MLRLTRPLLAMGLTASLLATVATLPAVAQSGPMRLAQAGPPQGGATLDVNVFYDRLGEHGSWVEHPDYQYVFIPSNVSPGWRPYQEGRWVWTDAYGWYWESYEPFGWATYHYGRWGYDPAYGWFWVPGDTWAPAWVTWRRGGGRTGWAPIAPDRPGYAVGRPVAYAPPVAESWVFVEDRYMGEEDLSPYVAPIPAIGTYLNAAPDYYEPSWGDGYYVNRGFGADVYGPPIRERIVSREVVYVDQQDELFYSAGTLAIFAPFIAFGDRYAPPPRYERRVAPDQRALIRQYVREDRDDRRQPGLFAPSAALLGALEPEQRRELRERRFGDPDGYRRDLDRIERERGDRIRELRREADSRADAVERERRQTVEQRRQQVERIRSEQRARAERVNARPDGAPGQRPGMAPGVRPDARPDMPPTPRPGMPPAGPDATRSPRPGPGPGQPAPRPDDAQRPQAEPPRPQIDRQRQQEIEQRRQPGNQQRPQAEPPRPQIDQQRQQEIERRRQQGDQQRQQMEQRRQQGDQQRQQMERRRQQGDQQRQQMEQRRQQGDQQRQQMEQRRQQGDQQRQQMEQRRQQMEQRRQQGDQQRQQMEQRRQQMEQRRQQADQPRPQQEQRRGPPPQQQGGGGDGGGKPRPRPPQPDQQ